MKTKQKNLHRWLFVLSLLIVLLGLLISGLVIKGKKSYPTFISDVYQEQQHHMMVPGKTTVQLNRRGAYGIYYVYDLMSLSNSSHDIPPEISCMLTSDALETKIEAVPDYVETNRYQLQNNYAGVLIMSLTVNKPGTYTLACDYNDGGTEPEIMVALGPNYFWEFIRVVWKIGFPVLGGGSILCGSILLSFLFLVIGIVIMVCNRKNRDPKLSD